MFVMKSQSKAADIIARENPAKFSGSFIRSFFGALFFLLVITSAIYWSRPVIKNPSNIWIVLVFYVLIYLGYSGVTNYFFVSDKHLLVKNLFLPWVNRI